MQDNARGTRLPEIAAAHGQLLAAIRAGDVSTAVAKVHEHILSTLPTLVARLDAQAAKRTP